jgi:hypothetical protein
MVFLYENGKGIVAHGKGTGETLKAEYEGTRNIATEDRSDLRGGQWFLQHNAES